MMRDFNMTLPLRDSSCGIELITFGPASVSSDAVDALLKNGALREVRAACGLDALIEALCQQDADVILCEVHGVPCEALLLPGHLQREFDAGRLRRLPAVLWISDLPRSILEACAGSFRTAGGKLQIATIATGVAASLDLFAKAGRGGAPAAAAPRFNDEDLILALDAEDGIRVVLQPQVDLKTGRILGAEALTRWRHPQLGEVAAADVVQAISRLSMDPMLFHVVTERVLDLHVQLAVQGVATRISVNAAVSTLSTPGVALSLEERTLRRGISPDQITVEITESETISDKTALKAGLERLRACGFGVSMDDFGTGASTLERLSCLPFSEIKVDQTFVRRRRSEPASHAVVDAAVGLGRALGLAVIAEGIETPEEASLLQSLGCRIGQGFGLARPMEIDVFVEKLLSAP
ncbi:EAL domain-containing protein [Achromobacter piechaudii]|uniref:Putative bacteriochlorophyll 4-vinyl reductase n=1 Tax=Achromobacter piechaudii ATCC 43553 TaxID=742159 RepID=D4XFM3_9BURK|nr:EAL domain-containing protein [Achromobacter piechaudii]EFF74315.1 putative bacteriochlorophyll 4-vinyl reductase [Achromobacter piechaudii ATCC 43553]